MRLARAGSADQDDVALLGDELAAGEVAHQILVDRRAFELEVVDILGERQLGDRELISDRTRVLLRYLRLEQIADEPLRLMLALERSGVNLVVGALHAVELEFTHHFDDFGSLHGQALLSWSYRAQSATGACWSFSASGVKIGATGPGSRRRARMLMITSDEWTPSEIAWAQAASTAGNPSVSTAERMATIWAPSPGVASHGVVAALVTKPPQLLEQPDQRQTLARRRLRVLRQHPIDLGLPATEFGARLNLSLVGKRRLPRTKDPANRIPRDLQIAGNLPNRFPAP